MQVPILSGIKADQYGEFREALPRNLVPVPMPQGISKGHLRPADGIVAFATGQGVDRGGIRWNDRCYRVSGSKLIRVDSSGSVQVLGDVGAGDPVSMDYSFDRLAIASGGSLYYCTGASVQQVTDPDLGRVYDVIWQAGYFVTTDGTSIVVTDLSDPTSVNPLHYGSSEADPDPVMALGKLGLEIYALNRFSIEAFENVGGTGFPFQRIDSAHVSRGIIGRRAFCRMSDTFFFLGGGRGDSGVEPPSVYAMTPGNSEPIATREIDTILQSYTEAQLADVVMEARVERGHQSVHIHLPDRCLVYDLGASKALQQPVWYTLDSGVMEPAQYRGRGFVWCYDRWIVGDPSSAAIGVYSKDTSEHFGQVIGWEFGTMAVYAGGNDAIVLELELAALPGRVAFGKDPVIWTSYTLDGETWSQERAISCGKQGERQKRLMWRNQGKLSHYRMQKFRGTSDARVTFAALEMQIEPLQTRPSFG
jgi:hypothetical protein